MCATYLAHLNILFSITLTSTLVPVHALEAHGRVEVKSHKFLTSALYGLEQQHHAPAILTPMKETPVPIEWKVHRRQIRSGRYEEEEEEEGEEEGEEEEEEEDEKSLFSADSRTTTPRISIPWPSHYTD